MTLEDFEKELAQAKKAEELKETRHRRKKESSDDRRHHKHHHHHSSRHHQSQYDEDEDDERRHKRRRRSGDEEEDHDSRQRRRHRHRNDGSASESKTTHAELERPNVSELKRDSWMEAPSALDVDYVQRPQKPLAPPKSNDLGANFELKRHEKELNHHLRDLHDEKALGDIADKPAQHEVDYN